MSAQLHRLLKEGAYPEALALADALVPFQDVHLATLCNALWVVQRDNTGLPFDARRARRYLAATLRRAPSNPEMHLNASGVFMELGEPEAAMRQLLLAKLRGVDLAPHLEEPLFAPLRPHERWPELVDGPAAPVDDVTWMEVVEDCFRRGEYDDAVPALIHRWRETHAPRIADLLDAIAHKTGDRSGYSAGRIERAVAEDPTGLWRALQGTLERISVDPRPIWLLLDLNDPRFSPALIALLLADPGQPSHWLAELGWRRLMSSVAAARDRRLIAPLRALSGWVEAMNPGLVGAAMREAFEEAAEQIELTGVAERLGEDEQAALSRLEASIGRAPDRLQVEVQMPAPPGAPGERDALLELWRRTRSPRVAELLGARELRAPTLRLEGRLRALDPRLQAELYDEVGRCGEEATQVLWEKRHEGPDPRVVEHLIRLLDEPPFIYPLARYGLGGVEHFWRELMETLKSCGDVRAVEPLRDFEVEVAALCGHADAVASMQMESCMSPDLFLRRLSQGVIRHLESIQPAELDGGDRALVEALEAEYAPELQARERQAGVEAIEKACAEALLRTVLAAPASDEARLSYAAYLEERDDPYGEFIRLQVLNEDPRQQRYLLEEYSDRFLGPLANLVSSPRWSRGFVEACSLNKYRLEDTDTDGLPLQTITVLQLGSMDFVAYDEASKGLVPNEATYALLRHPGFTSLRHLNGVPATALPLLVERGCPAVEALTLSVDDRIDPDATLTALGRIPSLRKVRVSLYDVRHLDAALSLLSAVTPDPIAAIGLQLTGRDRITRWGDVCEAWSRMPFPEFSVSSPKLIARFARNRGRTALSVVQRSEHIGPLLGVLLRLPAGTIQTFQYSVLKGATGPDGVQLAALRAALGRHPGLEAALPPASGEGRDVEAALQGGRLSVEALCSRAPEERFAVEALGYLRAEAGVDVLLDIARQGRWFDDACRALGQLGSARSVAPLIELLRAEFHHLERSNSRRQQLLGALGQLGAPEALEWLRRALLGGNLYDARHATVGLAMHGVPEDVALIEQAIARANERDAARFHIPLYTLAPERCDRAGARRVVASLESGWALDRGVLRCLVCLAGRLPADRVEERALIRGALRGPLRAWELEAIEDQIDHFSPARASWLALLEALARAWEIDR